MVQDQDRLGLHLGLRPEQPADCPQEELRDLEYHHAAVHDHVDAEAVVVQARDADPDRAVVAVHHRGDQDHRIQEAGAFYRTVLVRVVVGEASYAPGRRELHGARRAHSILGLPSRSSRHLKQHGTSDT